MKHGTLTLPLGVAAVFAALPLSVPASAQYVGAILPSVPYAGTPTARGIYADQQVGSTLSTGGDALLWNGSDGSATDLGGGIAYGVSGQYQAGAFIAYTLHGGGGKGGGGSHSYWHACLWHGSGSSRIDLNPTATGESRALAIDESLEVGWIGSSAALWHGGSPSSAVYLNPIGYTSSVAYGVSGNEEVGMGVPPYVVGTPGSVALLWTGTAASAVNLHPASLTSGASIAYGADYTKNEQVGSVTDNSSGSAVAHAYSWHGSAASGVDLNPTNSLYSEAVATRGGTEVGYSIETPGVKRATLWRGSAASALDLQQFLGNVGNSVATAIDSNGTITGYCDYGLMSFTLTPSKQPNVGITQTPAPDSTGVSTQPAVLTITSPYLTPTTTITYSVNGAPSTTVYGSTVAVTVTTEGVSFVRASSTDGVNHRTNTRQYVVHVDSLSPATTLSFVNSTVTLTGEDPSGDPVTTYYILDGGVATVYHAPFVVSDVPHSIEYWSVDPHGNTEVHHIATLPAAAPTLTSLSQTVALSGTADTTLFVYGTGFLANSEVLWNGTPLVTTYVGAGTLYATVTAADLNVVGVAQVSVNDPSPGLGESNLLPFSVLQRSTATGLVQNSGGASYNLSPITSSGGFTVSHNNVNIMDTATTAYLDQYGNGISAAVFYDTVNDGQSLTVSGVYSIGVLTAWTVQMH